MPSKLTVLVVVGSVVLYLTGADLRAYAAVSENPKVIPQLGHSAAIESLAYNSEKNLLASGGSGDKIKIWDAGTGRVIHTLSAESQYKVGSSGVHGLAFNSDGSLLASISDHLVELWSPDTGQKIHVLDKRYDFFVKRLTFSPDGAWLVIDEDIWDTSKWVVVHTLPASAIGPIVFLDKDRLLTIGSVVYIWNTQSWEQEQEFIPEDTDRRKHDHEIIAIDRYGRRAAIEAEGKISLWKLPEMRFAATSDHGLGKVNAMVFTSDGKWIVMATQTGIRSGRKSSDKEKGGGQAVNTTCRGFSPQAYIPGQNSCRF